nr:hypothetical protein Iba_chr14fCG8760 [Ipomoea batatas]
MIITQIHRIARITLLVVKEVLTTSNPTDLTFIAVILIFCCIIIIESTNFTEVIPKFDSTVQTDSCKTNVATAHDTNNLFNITANEFVMFLRITPLKISLQHGARILHRLR